MLLFAIDKTTKQIKHIDSVPNGGQCNCICPECSDELEAHNRGKIKAHHFKHTSKLESRSCLMTQLHIWGQNYFANSDRFLIEAPIIYYQGHKIFSEKYIEIKPVESKLEHSVGDYFADVFIITDIESLVLEIKVTHGCEQNKIDFLRKNNIASVEIDLSEYIDTPINKLEEIISSQQMKVDWIHPFNAKAIIDKYLAEQDILLAERTCQAKEHAKKILHPILKCKSVVLPALSIIHNAVDKNGSPASQRLVLQKKIKVDFDSVIDLSTEDYIWYSCEVKSRKLNIVGYYCAPPEWLNSASESTLSLSPLQKSLSWVSHSRMDSLSRQAVDGLKRRNSMYAVANKLIEECERKFDENDRQFKNYYSKWKRIIISRKLFTPSEGHKNPAIPKDLLPLSKAKGLWVFDAWPVYSATILLLLLDSFNGEKISHGDVFNVLAKEIGLSNEYAKILQFLNENDIDQTKFSLDKKSIIESLANPFIKSALLSSTRGCLVKNKPIQFLVNSIFK